MWEKKALAIVLEGRFSVRDKNSPVALTHFVGSESPNPFTCTPTWWVQSDKVSLTWPFVALFRVAANISNQYDPPPRHTHIIRSWHLPGPQTIDTMIMNNKVILKMTPNFTTACNNHVKIAYIAYAVNPIHALGVGSWGGVENQGGM